MKNLTWKQFGVITLILCGLILAFSPVDHLKRNDMTPQELASLIINREDHISAEQLGELIIDKNPGYILIDVRSAREYEQYHIKNAINIPMETLFNPDILAQIDPGKLIILYSNGGTHAAQAWILLKQFGFENALVLLGGLNYYVDVYSNPEPPHGVYADSEVFRYQFLKSAGSFLLGDSEIKSNENEQSEPLNIPTIQPKKRTKKADDGC